jgi:pimeloyl-ACP methyl ester carboxylesterase
VSAQAWDRAVRWGDEETALFKAAMTHSLVIWLAMPHHAAISIAVLATVLVTLLVRLALNMRYELRINARLKNNHDYRLRQDATYSQASKELEKLKDKIARKTEGAMIVDLIHDLAGRIFRVDREATPHNITFEQAFDIMNTVRSTRPDGPIVIILHTLGGPSLATEFIAAALKRHKGRVLAFVPYVAMSGGTLVALAADQIHLGSNAALGPIDTQYGPFAFAAYKKLYELKRERADDAVLLNYFKAEIREKSIKERLQAVAAEHNREAVESLLDPDLPHDRRITAQDAGDFHLHVTASDFPSEIYQYVETRLLMLRRYKELMVQPMQEALRKQRPPEDSDEERDDELPKAKSAR